MRIVTAVRLTNWLKTSEALGDAVDAAVKVCSTAANIRPNTGAPWRFTLL